MQATSLCSLTLLSRSLSGTLLRPRVPFVPHKPLNTTTATSFISASKRDSHGHHYDGKLVDENMILLRMRIREIEKEEMKIDAPSDWMKWEKKYFETRGSDIYDAVGLLQTLLMNTRPCLALGTLALVMLSMSMSMLLVAFHLVELAKGIICI